MVRSKNLNTYLYFSSEQNFITKEDYDRGLKLTEEIGKMLWTEIKKLEQRKQ